MLLLLNTVDAILCMTTFLRIVVKFELRSSDTYESKSQDPPTLYSVGVVTYIALISIERTIAELSGLATIILSVCRTIGMWMPFYRIKPTPIVIVFVLFAVVMATRNAFGSYLANWPIYFNLFTRADVSLLKVGTYLRIAVFTSIVTILFISTMMTVIKLLASIRDPQLGLPANDGKASKRSKVIMTTIILAIASIFFNGYLIIILLIDTVQNPSWPEWSSVRKSATIIAIPLNSMINPGIYFVRIKAIRRFWWNVARKMMTTANGTDSSQVVTNPLARPSKVSSTV